MSDSPVVILYDGESNPVGVILDGSIYRLQVESKSPQLPSTLGQKSMAASVSVVIASDQSDVSVDLKALDSWSVKQLNVGISAIQVASSPLSGRKTIALKAICTTGNSIYIGPTSAVDISGSNGGFPLANGETIELDLDSTATIYAIASAASQTLAYTEIAGG